MTRLHALVYNTRMHVHRSNRTERLVDVLAEVVARPIGEAPAPECIVVQGKGMERWLSMQLAQRFGVWANPDFPFPRKLIERAVAAVLGPEAASAPCFEPETMMWAIADLLPQYLSRAAFASIHSYLAEDTSGTKRIALAQRIAETFDQYLVYRPEMILEWEQGGGADWQAVLWRALVERHGATHIAARAGALLRAAPTAPAIGFPARVSLFGMSTLPPLYLRLLMSVAAHVELHLFVLSPSREYWADIRSRREVIRARRDVGADTLHLAEGHPLLASLGRIGREFQQVLEASGDYQETDADLYQDPGTGSLLTTVQSDILTLTHRGPRGSRAPLPYRDDDRSISVHACHSPMREVEVLHDQLLAAFDADRTLEPRDVVVMSPAIDAYAPLIDAVFGSTAGHARIPYRIADRNLRVTDEVVDAFGRLLAVLRGRLTATEVLDLLSMEAIHTRFGIAAEDLDLLRTWITEAGIRWGVDAAHRATNLQPAMHENTWRFGLDRLLLGYAMSGDERTLFRSVLPYDDVEGTGAALLGRLADFCETLFTLRAALEPARPLAIWPDTLSGALQRMIAVTPQTADQHQHIRSTLAELAACAATAGFHEPIDLDTLRSYLDVRLQRDSSSHGFLSGGVSFCALVPMRTIPFRVVCLLGMNDDLFPRAQRPFGFDLIAQRPRPGDRSSREDDRYLFLEALLSARQRLIITHVGQSVRDNREIPPSVVVSELLDTLDDSFGSDTTPLRERLVVRHPLQPFSPRNFGSDDPRRSSYSASHWAGARALGQPRRSAPPFVCAPLPPSDDQAAVGLDDLVRFFEHPARAFLQRRVQLYLGNDAPIVEDREPMDLDNLALWTVGDRLLQVVVKGADLATAFAPLRASGVLPLGVPGECLYDELRPQIELIGRRARELMRGGRCRPVEIDAVLARTRITGLLRDLFAAGQVRYQFSRLGGRHELGVWIRHLVLNWLRPPACAADSFIVGRPSGADPSVIVRFHAVADPVPILQDLLSLYWLGQTLPLPLFPRTSRAYVQALQSGGMEDGGRAALAAARAVFTRTGGPVPSEGEDVYVQQLFATCDPLDPTFPPLAGELPTAATFAAAARSVFEPLLAHREILA
ncbi:MAG TPA: exodeoxyribonuclease V subunit gamma [Candidatus Margulisiibacteriota bacterium]|nr:exodeoxyribonuclease V subunit gamma [Candidatus Margulisiibacteriota bacterium]